MYFPNTLTKLDKTEWTLHRFKYFPAHMSIYLFFGSAEGQTSEKKKHSDFRRQTDADFDFIFHHQPTFYY